MGEKLYQSTRTIGPQILGLCVSHMFGVPGKNCHNGQNSYSLFVSPLLLCGGA
jgi:hypothetical protein